MKILIIVIIAESSIILKGYCYDNGGHNMNKKVHLIVATTIGGIIVGYYVFNRRKKQRYKSQQIRFLDEKKESLKKEIEKFCEYFHRRCCHLLANYLCSKIYDIPDENVKEILEKEFPKVPNKELPWIGQGGKATVLDFINKKYGLKLNPQLELDQIIKSLKDRIKEQAWKEVVYEIEKYPLSDEDRKTLEKLKKDPPLWVC